MPASRTRVCPRCQTEKVHAEFREVGDTRGRPPRICRACRHSDADLTARHEANVARRPSARQQQAAYAARSELRIAAATEALHPEGRKTCPELSGCGRVLRLTSFRSDRHQADGLASVCVDCQAEAASLLA